MSGLIQLVIVIVIMVVVWLANRASEKQAQERRRRMQEEAEGRGAEQPAAQRDAHENDLETFLRGLRGEAPSQPPPREPERREPERREEPRREPAARPDDSALERSDYDDYLERQKQRRREHQQRREQEQRRAQQQMQAAADKLQAQEQAMARQSRPADFSAYAIRRPRLGRKRLLSARGAAAPAAPLSLELLGIEGHLSRKDLLRAIVMAEMLGPPLAHRPRTHNSRARRMI